VEARDALALATTFWGIAMAVSPAMQIRTMLRTGESKDVSIGYFLVLIVGFMLWVAYGLVEDVRILWICNSVATVFGIATVVVALRLRRRVRGEALPESGA
jgi:MtN3 and saliva related transmembrane protein